MRCEEYAKQQPEALGLHGQSFGCSIGPNFDVGKIVTGQSPDATFAGSRSTTIREGRLENAQQQGWNF
jgi:hypothetical protein